MSTLRRHRGGHCRRIFVGNRHLITDSAMAMARFAPIDDDHEQPCRMKSHGRLRRYRRYRHHDGRPYRRRQHLLPPVLEPRLVS